MKLLESAYNRVSSGKKTVEIRLFDKKCQKLNLGDTIEFSKLPGLKYKVKVKIIALLRYKSFRDLINDFGVEYSGHPKNHPIDSRINNLYTMYSKEEEKQYGILGIKIKLLNKIQN